MRKTLLATAIVCGGLTAISPASATAPLTSAQTATCLAATNHADLHGSFDAGMDLTRDQKVELKQRLAGYYGVQGFEGLAGIGLTAAEMKTIEARINAQIAQANAHPVGWPCAPFRHPSRVVSWARGELLNSGIHSVTFFTSSPRQIQFQGVADGSTVIGAIVKADSPNVIVSYQVVPGVGEQRQPGDSATFALSFDA